MDSKHGTLNIMSTSPDWRAHCLSNFPAFPFILDGKTYASVEGFIQGTKYPPGHPNRESAFGSWGVAAKRLGDEAERKFVWYGDEVVPYGTEKHRDLIERAIRAKFEQNAGALLALMATRGLTLAHDVGEPDPPNTSLPRDVFCGILTEIRDDTIG